MCLLVPNIKKNELECLVCFVIQYSINLLQAMVSVYSVVIQENA